MRAADQFHVGIVVDDLEASLAQFSDLFGFEWCDAIHVEQPVFFPSGEETVGFRSATPATPPRIEVIQGHPDTLWMPAAGSGIHHLGYCSDDVAKRREGHLPLLCGALASWAGSQGWRFGSIEE